jgi:hypothetical protein
MVKMIPSQIGGVVVGWQSPEPEAVAAISDSPQVTVEPDDVQSALLRSNVTVWANPLMVTTGLAALVGPWSYTVMSIVR